METSELNVKLKCEIGSWGKGLVLIGVIQIISMGFLDQFWGVLLIAAGLGNLLVEGLWTAFSSFQFLIGIKQFYKFFQWKNVSEEPD